MIAWVLATGILAADASLSESDRAAVQEVLARLERANNAGDVDGWTALFAQKFVYMAPGMPAVTSRDELVEVARAGFRNEADVKITPVEILGFGGDFAIARNEVMGSVKLHSGEVVKVDMKELVHLRREAGAWKIARLMINSNSD